MKTFNAIKYIGLLAIALLYLTGCEKDDSFKGKDNYLQNFSLQKDNTVLTASITEQEITIKAADDLSLEGAKVTFKLSEGAGIYPDPASVTNWNEDQQFVVTAKNGDKVTYTYSVLRASILQQNSVVLNTQAEVNEFAKLGITEIAGSLVIGEALGKDSINDLTALSNLRKIGYSLIINSTYSATKLVGFDRLTSVGDAIRIESVKNLSEIDFPALQSAGSIFVLNNTTFQVFSFPKLAQVTKFLDINAPIAALAVPNLKKVGGLISLLNYSTTVSDILNLSFPKLTESNGLIVNRMAVLNKISLPEYVKNTGDMNISILVALGSLSSPKLQTISGKLTISNAALPEVSFPSLTEIGAIELSDKPIYTLEMPKLTKVNGNFTMSSLSITGITELKSLAEVKGALSFVSLPNMTTFALPSSLKKVGRLDIIANSTATPVLSPVNIKGLEVGELNWEAAGTATLIGDDYYKGTLKINPRAAATYPTLQGFKEVDSLVISGSISNLTVTNIKRIHKGLTLPGLSMSTFTMPDLEQVDGNLTASVTSRNLTQTSIEFPKLRKVGGKLDVLVQTTAPIADLKFPILTEVGSDLNLGTGYDAMSLTNLSFPALTTVKGKLNIYASTNATRINKKLSNLDGFAALKTVTSISVKGQSLLTSFLGLKEALPAITAAEWTATTNSYNPTYADLAAGKWTK